MRPVRCGSSVMAQLKKQCMEREASSIMTISKDLLEILACPQCKGDIRLTEDGKGLICDHCRLLYEIRDDIPIMLIDEAKPLP